MFRKIHQAFTSKSCIMPKAVTHVEKSMCMGAAVVGLVVGSYIAYKGFHMSIPLIEKINIPDVHLPEFLDRVHLPEFLDKVHLPEFLDKVHLPKFLDSVDTDTDLY